MLRTARQQDTDDRTTGTAPLRRPGAVAVSGIVARSSGRRSDAALQFARAGTQHPLCQRDENVRLMHYEDDIKQSFDRIVPTLKRISAIQHEDDFEQQAQRIAREQLGMELPASILADAWVDQLDMKRLFAWCVFQTYSRFCNEFFSAKPTGAAEKFENFLQSCGFHSMDISPCADGRLAHMVRYVLRLSPRAVRRKSYAGAMFDIEESLQKWTETELQRFREGVPNPADAQTRYLKVAVYHFSSSDPDHEGCAAHGSDTQKAAEAALQRLENFRQAIENSFCCGASVDLLLLGVDTDTDALRIHVPGEEGRTELGSYIDTQAVYNETARVDAATAVGMIESKVRECSPGVADGMARLVARLVENNLSQIEYVQQTHGQCYPDIGHAEKLIGVGVGFEEIQLRNLKYFAHLTTLEEGAADLDVGVRIFTALNVSHGLPVPIVVRFDYHGGVPGARERAVQRCGRVADSLMERYSELAGRGLLHVMQVVRDSDGNGPLEPLACTVDEPVTGSH